MASRFFARSWGSRKSHALVKVQAKLLSQRHWKIQWLRWDCLFLPCRTVQMQEGSAGQIDGAALSHRPPRDRASSSFLKMCRQNLPTSLPLPFLSLEPGHMTTWSCMGAGQHRPQLGSHLPWSSVTVCVCVCVCVVVVVGRESFCCWKEGD